MMLQLEAAFQIVADNITATTTISPSYGLQFNSLKCEIISKTGAVNHDATRGFQQATTDTSMLLGAPLSTGSALTKCLASRCTDLSRATESLKFISAHNALVLLKTSSALLSCFTSCALHAALITIY